MNDVDIHRLEGEVEAARAKLVTDLSNLDLELGKSIAQIALSKEALLEAPQLAGHRGASKLGAGVIVARRRSPAGPGNNPNFLDGLFSRGAS